MTKSMKWTDIVKNAKTVKSYVEKNGKLPTIKGFSIIISVLMMQK